MLGWLREQEKDLEAPHATTRPRWPWPRRGRRSTTASASSGASRAGRKTRSPLFRKAVPLDPRLFDARYHLGATLWWTGDAAGALPELRGGGQAPPGSRRGPLLSRPLPAAGGRPPGRGGAAPPRDRAQCVAAARLLAAGRGPAGVGRPRRGPGRARPRAIALDPSQTEVRNTLGLVWMAKGESEEALAAFRAVLAQDPANVTARHNLGSALMQKGDVEGAAALYRELTAAHPDNAEAFYNLGVALKQRDDFEGAEAALRRAIALETPGRSCRRRRTRSGSCCGRRRGPRRRRPPSAPPSPPVPRYAEAHYMLGTVLRQLEQAGRGAGRGEGGHPPRARATRRRTSASARCCGRRATRRGRRRPSRSRSASTQRKADDQAATFAVSAGMKKLAAKDLTGAIASFREAVRLAPDHAQAQYQLGLALRKAGLLAEARRHLARAAAARALPGRARVGRPPRGALATRPPRARRGRAGFFSSAASSSRKARVGPAEADLVGGVAEADAGLDVGLAALDVVLLDDGAVLLEVLDHQRRGTCAATRSASSCEAVAAQAVHARTAAAAPSRTARPTGCR